jgi:hypothetical protein
MYRARARYSEGAMGKDPRREGIVGEVYKYI